MNVKRHQKETWQKQNKTSNMEQENPTGLKKLKTEKHEPGKHTRNYELEFCQEYEGRKRSTERVQHDIKQGKHRA